MRRTRRVVMWFAPLLGGVLVAFSLPPFGLWPFAFVGVALLAWAVRDRSIGARTAAGFLAGGGQFAIGLAWADKFTFLGYAGLIIIYAAMFALACLLVPTGPVRMPALAALLTLAEWARGHWPFGGVPPGGIALGQVSGPLAGTARIGGTVLLVGATYLAGVSAGDFVVTWFRRRRTGDGAHGTGLIGCSLSLSVVAALAVWGVFAADGGPPVRTLRAAIVQGGGRRGLSDLQVPASVVYAAALRATMLVRPPVALVLWPEDVVALGQPLKGTQEALQLSEIARDLHTTLFAGVTWPVGTTRFRNEIVAYGPSGALVASFEKVHRVPFGEYVPWRSFFAHFADLKAVSRDAIAGHGSGMMVTPVGRVAVLVSYEVFFPGRGRSGVRAGGQLILVPTNTSSYSSEQAPAQEIAASRLQAIEEGRDLLQAAPTGYSAVIDNHGDVLEQTPLSVMAVLRTNVALRDGVTLYTRVGDLPTVSLALFAVLAGWVVAVVARRRERRRDLRRPAGPAR